MPQWRTAKAGWIILNSVIGLGVGVGAFIVAWIFIVSSHVDLQALDQIIKANADLRDAIPEGQRILATIGGAFFLCLAAGVLAWLLFAYLRAKTIVRTALLIAIPLVALLLGYGMMHGTLPKLPGY